MKWQPIETAPKDGSYFLAYFPLNGLHDGWCRTVPIYYTKSGEYVFASRAASGFSSAFQPTHWMPLPAAPES